MTVKFNEGQPARRVLRVMAAVSVVAMVAACEGPLDFDMRGRLGSDLDTSGAAVHATADRPGADRRGVISYPNYQVAVARRGDRLRDVAARVGVDAQELASYNGMTPEDELRRGEVLALPRRVEEPSAATGGTGVVRAPSDVDITSVAGGAIERADGVKTAELDPIPAAKDAPSGETGVEPIRHKVSRGETAFTIARLYGVSVRALAEWNGLGRDFVIREDQILLIPPVVAAPEEADATPTSKPGDGSPTPTPPSASKPLPEEDIAAAPPEPPASPDLGSTQSESSSNARMDRPVDGKIIRAYAKDKNNGVDFSAPAGTAVRAADDGTVAAITTDADNIQILVVRHPGNMMTVYYNVADVAVEKGSAVRRGSTIAAVPQGDNYVHFEVRKGFDSVDPMPYLE